MLHINFILYQKMEKNITQIYKSCLKYSMDGTDNLHDQLIKAIV